MREKLIELLYEFPVQMEWHDNEELADYLIDQGVNFATDNNVGDKWIPVTERPPSEEDANENGMVLAYTHNHECLIVNYRDVWRFREFVFAWMPLPEPPKED